MEFPKSLGAITDLYTHIRQVDQLHVQSRKSYFPAHASGRAEPQINIVYLQGKIKEYVLSADCFNCLMTQK